MAFRDVVFMIIGLFGGLGLFLYGMRSLGSGLEKVAGTRLKSMLQAVTRNRFLAMLVGIVITVLMQSSTATTVMTVGFVSANLINLTQAIGVIMGANIGTTVTPLLLSLEGLNFGMLFAFIGTLLHLLPEKNPRFRTAREFSGIVISMGLLFIGMDGMKNAMAVLQQWDGFSRIILGINSPLLGVLVGMLLTIILSSSAACVGILQALASQGLIPLQTSIFILFGMNIGTCLTSLLAGASAGTTAKRASLVHLLFNVSGTVIFVVFACLAPFATWIENAAPGNLMLQVALVHIVFNVVTTILLMPCADLLEKLACLMVPEHDAAQDEMRLKFYNPRLANNPSIAVATLLRETERMSGLALDNYRKAFHCFTEWTDEEAQEVNRTEDLLDYLNREITARLVDIRGMDLNEADTKLSGAMIRLVNDLERVGDHSVNILEAGQTKQTDGVKFSAKVTAELTDLSAKVDSQLETSIRLFMNQKPDPDAMAAILTTEEEIDTRTEALRVHHVERVKQRKCSAKNGMLYLDMLTNLERIGDHAENIASYLQPHVTPAGGVQAAAPQPQAATK